MGYIENDDDDTAIGGRKLVIMRLLLNTQNIFFVLVIVLLCTVSVIFRKCKRTAALSRPSGCLSQNFMEQIFVQVEHTQCVPSDMNRWYQNKLELILYSRKLETKQHENEDILLYQGDKPEIINSGPA